MSDMSPSEKRWLERIAHGELLPPDSEDVDRLVELGLVGLIPSGNSLTHLTPRGHAWLMATKMEGREARR